MPKKIDKRKARPLILKHKKTVIWSTYSQWKNFIKNPDNYKSLITLKTSLKKLSQNIEFEEDDITSFEKLYSRIE
jgi:hypothetical protein